jgi:hypothetical protein
METVAITNHQSASMPSRKKFLGHVKKTHEGDLRMMEKTHVPLKADDKPNQKKQLKN